MWELLETNMETVHCALWPVERWKIKINKDHPTLGIARDMGRELLDRAEVPSFGMCEHHVRN